MQGLSVQVRAAEKTWLCRFGKGPMYRSQSFLVKERGTVGKDSPGEGQVTRQGQSY